MSQEINNVVTITIQDDKESASTSTKPENSVDEKENCFNICPICFESSESQVVLPCKHSLHLSCYNMYLLKNMKDGTINLNCPYCSDQIVQVMVERQATQRQFPTFVVVGDPYNNSNNANDDADDDIEPEEDYNARRGCINRRCLHKTCKGIFNMGVVALIVYLILEFANLSAPPKPYR